jgi:hypothetical protein
VAIPSQGTNRPYYPPSKAVAMRERTLTVELFVMALECHFWPGLGTHQKNAFYDRKAMLKAKMRLFFDL